MNKELDCRGLQCPEPVARCRALLKDNAVDELNVLVDNTAALENVSRFLTRNGFTAASEQLSENEWIIRAGKSETTEVAAPAAEGASGKTLVLLTTETLGRGDDELGAKLMNTFLASLPELGDSLWRIVMLNGAVKLCAKDGEALKSLEKLAAAGTGIFVCGTCLMHYGLLEQKKIGETTNMMDIMTSLSLAQKIIRP